MAVFKHIPKIHIFALILSSWNYVTLNIYSYHRWFRTNDEYQYVHGTECTIKNATPKQTPTTLQKLKQKQTHPRARDCPNISRDTRVTATLVVRPPLIPIAPKLFRCEYGLFMSRKCVYSQILLRIVICATVRKTFSNMYTCKEVPDKTIHRPVTKFREGGRQPQHLL
jgi:hypothetical protein